MKKRRCIIGQSGGPTVAINSSLAGVIDGAIASSMYERIYGMRNGIEGLLDLQIVNLSERFTTLDLVERLRKTPAMYLGSCRYKLDTNDTETLSKIFSILENFQIDDFFYIGGNDSMDTILKLSDYGKQIDSPIRFIGIPKTIDNDLVGTDHTPGFGSAAKYIATTMLEVMYDCAIYNKPSITIVEIMGRNAGWLTAAAALAKTEAMEGVDLIYLPELAFDVDQFLNDVDYILQTKKKQVLVAVSEGIKDKKGNYIQDGEISGQVDAFGHISRSGAGKALEKIAANHFQCKVRSVEINVLQRSCMHCASETDLKEAFLIGRSAVGKALEGNNGIMLTYERVPGNSYQVRIGTVDVHESANKERLVPREWINKEGNHVNGTMINYLTPLIQGEVMLEYKGGVPSYLPLM
ncbi:6-phosphofructokinase [Velocimicrobium porci]|uniref:Pyrophosphate--fructose 6-phosphate 1-phosphotransferase n=1 Tax=Velocimicrobium porci TaxID=2606634 RepID=A0A6L5Y136_9FIRM|nr:6-phosphofructokinase [Velocimicrobium porci]MSS64118.1 6-phosphofructokinase [Velocimicrobium porci]